MIQQLLDYALKEKNKPRKRSGLFSPSMLGRCYRAQIWNRMNIEQTEPPDERTFRVFEVGHIFHNFIQDLLLKQNPEFQKEVMIKTEHFCGFADLVEPDEVTDIKSMHSRGFFYLNADTITKEKKPAIMQVLWYAKELKKKQGRIVFVSKDDLCIAEYVFPLNEFWSKALANEEKTLIEAWEKALKGVLPPAKPRAFVNKQGLSAECSKYCSWKSVCQKIEKERGEVK